MVWYQRRQNKYRSRSAIYNGISYHSAKEAAYAQELDLRLKAKGRDRIKSWRRQIRFDLSVNGYHICNHYVDFEVTHQDGSVELVETKGFATEMWRLKRKILEATYLHEHPEVTYTVVT